jgi:SNF family Na+-dependent transporter
MAGHAVLMAITTFIVARGVKGGIELAVKILMPAFSAMLLLITIASAGLPVKKFTRKSLTSATRGCFRYGDLLSDKLTSGNLGHLAPGFK